MNEMIPALLTAATLSLNGQYECKHGPIGRRSTISKEERRKRTKHKKEVKRQNRR